MLEPTTFHYDYTDGVPWNQLVPAIPESVQLIVTSVFTSLYSLIFLTSYIQLWLLLCLGYSRRWHPFGLLWLSLFWAGLRILLFSFYWPSYGILPGSITHGAPSISDSSLLSPILSYFLYAFPSCIQFMMLCLVASFAIGISSREFEEPVKTTRMLRGLLILMCLTLLLSSIIAVVLNNILYASDPIPLWLTASRVLVQDALFLTVSVFLVIILRRVAKLPHVSLILESLNTGRCGLLFTGSFLVLTFASRALYDIIALSLRSIPSFDFGWIDLSDHAEITERLGPNAAYAVFAGVLLIWDLFPTAVVLFLFRLRRPQFIRAPATGATPFWGDDNFADDHMDDWQYQINGSPEEHEALIASINEDRMIASPSVPAEDSYGYRAPVKFGVGSVTS